MDKYKLIIVQLMSIKLKTPKKTWKEIEKKTTIRISNKINDSTRRSFRFDGFVRTDEKTRKIKKEINSMLTAIKGR